PPPRRAFPAGHRGLLQFPRLLSYPVVADTPPAGAAASDSLRTAPFAFARCRPSQPPENRVTRLLLRSLVVTTGYFAHPPFRVCCRRAPPSWSPATVPPKLRGLSLLTSVGLSPTRRRILSLDTPAFQRDAYNSDSSALCTSRGSSIVLTRIFPPTFTSRKVS